MHFILTAAPTMLALRLVDVDSQTAGWFRERLSPSFADLLYWLSGPGCEVWVTSVLVMAAIFMTWRRHWYALATLLLTVPCGALLGQLLKWLVHRPRPFVGGPFGDWGGYSFPSGHTLAATLLYGFFAALLIPLCERRRFKTLCIASSALLVLAVAFSRVALGAHYVTDVLGGMLMGSMWVTAVALMMANVRRARATIASERQVAVEMAESGTR